MVLKLEKIFRVLHRGFGRREITWVQTGFLRCIDGFPVWKGRCEVAGFSNVKMSRSVVRKQNYRILKSGMTNNCNGLEEDKIAWCSNAQNSSLEVMIGLEEDKIT